MRFLVLFIFLAQLAQIAQISVARAESFEEFFQQAVKLYQDHKFEDAKQSFEKSLQVQPDNVAALTNLALVQFQLGAKGLAVGNLRKARYLDPDFATAKSALSYVTPQLEVHEIPHEILWTENLRTQVLDLQPISSWLLITAMLFGCGAWVILSFFDKRKKALKSDAALPSPPVLGSFVFICSFVGIFLCTMKYLDSRIVRATIIAPQVSALSAPDEKAPAIFDLYAGLEVIVQTSSKSESTTWVQVNYPGGSSGWVKADAILVTNQEGTSI